MAPSAGFGRFSRESGHCHWRTEATATAAIRLDPALWNTPGVLTLEGAEHYVGLRHSERPRLR